MRLVVTVGLAFVAWASILGVLLVGRGGLDLYVVLLLIGLLVIRELAGASATRDVTARMNVFIALGVLAFVYVVVARVRDILNL